MKDDIETTLLLGSLHQLTDHKLEHTLGFNFALQMQLGIRNFVHNQVVYILLATYLFYF